MIYDTYKQKAEQLQKLQSELTYCTALVEYLKKNIAPFVKAVKLLHTEQYDHLNKMWPHLTCYQGETAYYFDYNYQREQVYCYDSPDAKEPCAVFEVEEELEEAITEYLFDQIAKFQFC